MHITGKHRISDDVKIPLKVKAIPLLKSNIIALGVLLAGEIPYRIPTRILGIVLYHMIYMIPLVIALVVIFLI